MLVPLRTGIASSVAMISAVGESHRKVPKLCGEKTTKESAGAMEKD